MSCMKLDDLVTSTIKLTVHPILKAGPRLSHRSIDLLRCTHEELEARDSGLLVGTWHWQASGSMGAVKELQHPTQKPSPTVREDQTGIDLCI